MAFYSSTDAWPNHPKPWYREVYKMARDHGWTLETHSSHTGSATLRCPGGSCSLKVFATGRGGESVAKQHKREIERCPHGQGTTDALSQATELLEKAERLLDALDARLERNNLEDRAQALLIDDEVHYENEILDLWQAADALAMEADALLAGLGSPGHEEIVATTDNALSEARGLLRPLPRTDDVTRRKSRARALRDRCDAWRKLISHS